MGERRSRSFRGALPAIRFSLGAIFAGAPLESVGIVLLGLLASQFSIAGSWVQALIIDTAVKALQGGATLWVFAMPLSLQLALAFVQHIHSWMASASGSLLNLKVGNALGLKAVGKTAALDLAALEDHRLQDSLMMADFSAAVASALPTTLIEVLKGFVALLVTALLLWRFDYRVAVLTILACLPSLWSNLTLGNTSYQVELAKQPETRKKLYLGSLFRSPLTAQEIKVYGLRDYLLGKYSKVQTALTDLERSMVGKRNVVTFATSAVSSLAYLVALLLVIRGILGGRITIGQLTFYSSLVIQAQGLLNRIAYLTGSLFEISLRVDQFVSVLALTPAVTWPKTDTRISSAPRVEFRGVSFRYASGQKDALAGLNLSLAPGERLAIVGENGAGKSTLAKLLLRFHDPTEGQILVDGADLKSLDLEGYWQGVGYLPQDFTRYEMTARENIAFGQVASLNDTESLLRAADASGIRGRVESFPEGLETVLGTMFEGGHQLSPGEWQRLALSRVFLRTTPLLVMDEPTSSIDPHQEAEILNHILELSSGRTAVIISHRMALARVADRVVVLESGRVAEEGTHDQLMALRGVYHHLFTSQAQWYA